MKKRQLDCWINRENKELVSVITCMSHFILDVCTISQKLLNPILENFILRQILENFSEIEIQVGEPWNTNSKLATTLLN